MDKQRVQGIKVEKEPKSRAAELAMPGKVAVTDPVKEERAESWTYLPPLIIPRHLNKRQ